MTQILFIKYVIVNKIFLNKKNLLLLRYIICICFIIYKNCHNQRSYMFYISGTLELSNKYITCKQNNNMKTYKTMEENGF